MIFDFKKALLVFVLLLCGALVCFGILQNAKADASFLEVSFLDVGQGDAALVNYLGEYQVLIDGGPNGRKLLSELGKAMSPFDRKIEIVVLTHPDQDHLAGLIDVLQNYEVGLFLHNGQDADTNVFGELKQVLEKKKVRSEHILEGSQFSIGEHLDFRAFNPDFIQGQGGDRNEQSVVLRLDFGENSFLFAGDAEEKTELDMIGDQEDLDVDWLKVAHHGSKSSTSEFFLSKAKPSYAVISAGKENRYGHPADEVLQRLQQVGAEIFRTDETGTITVQCQSPQAKCVVK